MHQEAHRMQLRSRQGDKCNKVTSQPVVNRRSVLTDVSNRRSGRNKLTRNSETIKNVKSKKIRVLSASSQLIQQEEIDLTRRNRRKSARLSVKHDREDGETNEKETKKIRIETKEIDSSKITKKRRRSRLTRSNEDEQLVENDSKCQVHDVDKSSPIITDGSYVVRPDYRLQRDSFDGKNHTLGIAEHDIDSRDDVLQVIPYITDIFQNLFHTEEKCHPRMYMHAQSDINAKMRAILIDWLVEVHMKFRLAPETLYLCVNIIDRYCCVVNVKRSKLQLVGVTALLLACKYEEIYPPEVKDCVYITDRAYQRSDVLNMEQDIVHKLRFKMTVPTAYPFLQRFLNLVDASPLTRHAANYYMERTLQEHDMLSFKPSMVAISAVVLALNNPDIRDSSTSLGVPVLLVEYSNFQACKILECATLLSKKVSEEPVTASRRQLVAVKRKFDSRKYLNVSTTIDLPNANTICK